MCYVQDKFATDMARINSGEVQGVLVQQMKPPAKDGEVKKKRIQGRWNTVYSVQPHSREIWRTPNYSFHERQI